MSKHRQLVYGQPIPQDFLDALQEFLGMQHSGVQLNVVAPGTVGQPANQVQVAAATGNGQVGLAINGLWRYVSASPPAISITGAPGTYDIFACCNNNSFAVNPSPPPPEIDSTDYTFTLQALVQGSTPTSPPNYRKIGECVFDGTRILYLRQTLGGGDSYRQHLPGQVIMSAAASAPPGFLLCDGTAYSRATYGVLYAAMGGPSSPFGQGDGTNTFNVPNFAGRGPIGVGTSTARGAASHTLGQATGEETHNLSNGEMPVHSHGAATQATSTDHWHSYSGTTGNDSPDHAHNVTGTGWQFTYAGGGVTSFTVWSNYGAFGSSGATARHAHGFSGNTSWQSQSYNNANHQHGINNDGGGADHNNLGPSLCVNFFIKF